ncbi:hypothetical protein, partial [Paenibacillus sp. AR247]|uniref:hypothetical protein n=1 Tax=Paenibacillus sp. AR247 TaxID=1631599 RepID=UPI001C613312
WMRRKNSWDKPAISMARFSKGNLKSRVSAAQIRRVTASKMTRGHSAEHHSVKCPFFLPKM